MDTPDEAAGTFAPKVAWDRAAFLDSLCEGFDILLGFVAELAGDFGFFFEIFEEIIQIPFVAPLETPIRLFFSGGDFPASRCEPFFNVGEVAGIFSGHIAAGGFGPFQ